MPSRSLQPAVAPASTQGHQLAAVDLGSNSFHLVIARVHGEEISMLDRVRDQVQLARGLGRRGKLSKKKRERALRALERFNQRLGHVPDDRVRAVGTSTLRRAKDADAFLAQAEAALGHPIEVISGHEEGRLIHLGVAHSLPAAPGARLVVDIGGGSTECILGEGFEALAVHSLDMGCVAFGKTYFPKGVITRDAYEAARLAAQGEFQTLEQSFRATGWAEAVGASGTIRAAEAVLREQGWGARGITPAGLKKLRKAMIAAGSVRGLQLAGLKRDRTAVFPGGVAILHACFDRLGVKSMTAVSGALREGVLYDLLGRFRREDVRERTIRTFQQRYRVDVAQASRVERTALSILSHVPPRWGLDPSVDGRVLAWAARLHEIGLAVSWSHSHRHSGYLLRHADMPGFSRAEQAVLAALVGCHRRKFDPAVLEDVPPGPRDRILHLLIVLRLAILVHRARSPEPIPPLRIEEEGGRLRVVAPHRWLDAHPLTRMDLAAERGHLKVIGVHMEAP